MSEDQLLKPASSGAEIEAAAKQEKRRPSAAGILILLVVIVGAALWTVRTVRETNHPAIRAARGLGASTPAARLEAVRSLTDAGITDPAYAIPPLTSVLNDPDVGVRTAAIESLGLLLSYSIRNRAGANEARAAIGPLLAALKDSQADARIAAIHVLSRVRAVSPSGPRLTPKKETGKPAPLIEPDIMINAMTEMCADHDAAVRAAAVKALCEAAATNPAAGLASSTVALVDEDAQVRAAAAEGVGQLISHAVRDHTGETEARAAAPKLLAATKDSQAAVRTAAIAALKVITTTRNRRSGRRSEQGSQTIDPPLDPAAVAAALTEAIGDQDPSVRLAAIKALGSLDPTAISPSAVPTLIAALKNGDSDIRYEVILVLSELGSKAAGAIPAFIAALSESAETDHAKVAGGAAVRGDSLTGPAYAAADALGKIAPGSSYAGQAVKALAEVVVSGPSPRRPGAADALGKFKAQAAPAIPALIKMLKETSGPDVESDDGARAAAALGQIAPGTPSAAAAAAALQTALGSTSTETRKAATLGLERLRAPDRTSKP